MSPLTGLGLTKSAGTINIPPLRGSNLLPTAICLLPTWFEEICMRRSCRSLKCLCLVSLLLALPVEAQTRRGAESASAQRADEEVVRVRTELVQTDVTVVD